MLLTGLLYIVIPTILIFALAVRRQSGMFNWILSILLTGLAVSYIMIIARWEIVSIYFKYFFSILYLFAFVMSYKRMRKSKKAESKILRSVNIGISTLLILFLSLMNFLALRGYRVPGNTVELSSPFRHESFIVINGGSRPMINAHFNGSAQSFALDIVGLNHWGMRASTVAGGANLSNYVIYGKPIYSPCEGEVLIVVDEFDDLIPPGKDTVHIAGNHILIDFDGKEVLLAHFKKGSIKVKVGDRVDTNTLLGEVGNTGNTSEPHLHVHVEQGGVSNTILNGKAIPFTIDGKYLKRGDIIN